MPFDRVYLEAQEQQANHRQLMVRAHDTITTTTTNNCPKFDHNYHISNNNHSSNNYYYNSCYSDPYNINSNHSRACAEDQAKISSITTTTEHSMLTHANSNHQPQLSVSYPFEHIQCSSYNPESNRSADFSYDTYSSTASYHCCCCSCCCCCSSSLSQYSAFDEDFYDPLLSSVSESTISIGQTQCVNSLISPPQPNTHNRQGISIAVPKPASPIYSQHFDKLDKQPDNITHQISSSSLASYCTQATGIVQRVGELDLDCCRLISQSIEFNNCNDLEPNGISVDQPEKRISDKLSTVSSPQKTSPQTAGVHGACVDQSNVYEFREEKNDTHNNGAVIFRDPIIRKKFYSIGEYNVKDKCDTREAQVANWDRAGEIGTRKRFAPPDITDMAENKARKRVKTRAQLIGLEAVFMKQSGRSISREQRFEIAKSLKLDPEEVRLWYKYQRHKMLQQAR